MTKGFILFILQINTSSLKSFIQHNYIIATKHTTDLVWFYPDLDRTLMNSINKLNVHFLAWTWHRVENRTKNVV